jgi:2'-5' RNA ligase
MIRLFVAIAVPPEAGAALAALCEGVPGAHWHPAEKLHLTLRFVGEIDEALAEDLDAELSGVTGPALDLTLAGVGAFETKGKPDHLWVGVEAGPELMQLRKRCEAAARRAGLAADVRVWKPHVTLAYLERGAYLDRGEPRRVAAWIAAHNLLRLAPLRVRSFGLYSSWRSRHGQAYRLERDYPLSE